MSLTPATVIGVDLGGTNLRAALVDRNGKILDAERVPTPPSRGAEVVGEIAALVRRLAGSRGVLGVGIGSPGLVDQAMGRIVVSANFPEWRDVPLGGEVGRAVGLPVFLENDANAAALGESWVGAGSSFRHFVLYTLGTGVGGGIVLDGDVWRGADGAAGEVGHVMVDPEGPVCGCGSRGCLEMFASATAIVRMAREALEGGADSAYLPADESGWSRLAARDVWLAAREGDAVARSVFHRVGRSLGIAAAGVISLLNPQAILIGGGAAEAWDFFIEDMMKEMKRRTYSWLAERTHVLPAGLGADAGLLGAARAAWLGVGRAGDASRR
ncbi:MAG: hypothetical protein A2V83_00575 [Nitrospirae bacterium RBG_16_64_22]|nr:MAG: hypothetical protein A2V83_00575 [Nitrospirae bacterium RBG_16_64_22]